MSDLSFQCLFTRYYCCLFLARMHSAPLVKLDGDICVTIDELIDVFLEQHVPNEISKWEEEMSFVWMTMVPLVHLAFAAGKEYYCNNIHGSKCDVPPSESKQFETVKSEVAEAGTDGTKELQSSLGPLLNSYNGVENRETICKRKKKEKPTLSEISENTEIETSVSRDKKLCDARQQCPIHMARFHINTKTWNLFSNAHAFTQREPAVGSSRESLSIHGVSVMAPKGG